MSAEGAALLSDDQAAVYDRQLRVWGVEVQNRLTAARVLIVGLNATGLAAEVAKNLVLAGIGSVSLSDYLPAQPESTSSPQQACQQLPVSTNFLLPASPPASDDVSAGAAASAKTLQAMNPLVSLSVAPPFPTDSSLDVGAYSLVVGCGLPLAHALELDHQCSAAGVKLMLASVRGWCSYAFANLHEHSYSEKDKPDELLLRYCGLALALSQPPLPPKCSHPLLATLKGCYASSHGKSASAAGDASAVPAAPVPADVLAALSSEEQALAVQGGVLEACLAAEARAIRLFTSPSADSSPSDAQGEEDVGLAGVEFAPVCSVVGGVLTNHAIRAVSGVGAPFRNFFLYSLADGKGVTLYSGP